MESPDRQSDINDYIPAVFGATFAASLFATLISGGSQKSNSVGKLMQQSRE